MMTSSATICASCGSENSANSRFCLNCGAALGTGDKPQGAEQETGQHWPEQGWAPSPEIANADVAERRAPQRRLSNRGGGASSSRRGTGDSYAASSYAAGNYGAMRGIAELCRVISYVFVGVGILGALVGLITMADSFFVGAGAIVSSALFAAFNYIIFRLLGEIISVIIDIEANTRRTAQLLEKSSREN